MKKIYPAKDCLSERLNYDICSPFYLPSLMGVTKKMLDIFLSCDPRQSFPEKLFKKGPAPQHWNLYIEI